MERRLLSEFQRLSTLSPKSTSAALSLITNPATSEPTLSTITEALNLHLQNPNPNANHLEILSLLSTLSHHHPQFRPRVSATAHAFILLPSTSITSIPYAISLLDDCTLSDESLFLSLCYCQSVKTRIWTLRNATKFGVRPSVLVTVFLGFTKDPYPYVRVAALDGLVLLRRSGFVVEDLSLVGGCYFRAVELLFDGDSSVRRAAVCAVSEWGQLLVALNSGELKGGWADTLFLQLCLMARDMDMETRVDAFVALGKIQSVSVDILQQTLSKKAFTELKEKSYPGQYTVKVLKIPASASAFTFAHGLEDEFYEVRRSACYALQMLTAVSANFAGEAVHRVMDLLNDDSLVVRLQALETVHHMNMQSHPKVEESHLHMFLGSLLDNSDLVRSAARKALQSTKLQEVAMFRSCIDVLIKNMELYPQDEAEVLSVIFKVGRIHGNFVASIIREVSQELEPSSGGKMGYNNVKTAALLVLAISAPVSFERHTCCIPSELFSYAVTLLGRISRGLVDIMDKNSLLTYLSHCSRFTVVSASEFRKADLNSKDSDVHLLKEISGTSRTHFNECMELHNVTDLPHGNTLGPPVKTTSFTETFFHRVVTLWPLMQHGCQNELIRTLRNWKEELKKCTCKSNQSGGVLDFAMKYVRVIKFLGKAWPCYMSIKCFHLSGMGALEALLGKTESELKEMLYRFTGLGREDELLVLELILVTYVMKLSQSVSSEAYMEKVNFVLSRIEYIHKEGSAELSKFVLELQNISQQLNSSEEGSVAELDMLEKSLDLFSLRHFELTGELNYLKAELGIHDNSFQNPLPFVSGLPVGIPLDITLYNISTGSRLWLVMTLSGSTQFVFLDTNEFKGCNEIRKSTFIAPFHGTPKAKCFSLKVSIAMECFSELRSLKQCGGPKHDLVHLCKEREVYLSAGGE